MSFAEELIGRIDTPDHPTLRTLQQQAIDEIRPIIADADIPEVSEGVIRRLSYTYYYDWETDDPEYIWLVQDPGNLRDRHLSELRGANPIADGCSPREQISVYRQFGKSWLTGGRNEDFSERVLTALDELGLIDLGGSWRAYLNRVNFYRDIYLGDVVKYRTDDFGQRAERISYTAFLEEEIRELEPSLLFSFGGNAWSTIRRETDPTPVESVSVDPDRITDVHGTLHRVDAPVETYVLPLSHMSGRVWWGFSPEDYVDRLTAGLERWRELR